MVRPRCVWPSSRTVIAPRAPDQETLRRNARRSGTSGVPRCSGDLGRSDCTHRRSMRYTDAAGSAVLPPDRSMAKPDPVGQNVPTVHPPVTLVLPAARVARAMLAIVAGLTLLSVAGQASKYLLGHDRVFGFVHEFNVSHEGNIPTWYASFSLLGCAALLGLIGLDERRSRRRHVRHWFGLSVLLLSVAIDEGSGLHELMNDPLRAAFHTHGVLFYPAAAVGAVFAAVLAAIYARFLLSLPPRTRWLFAASAAVYLGGGLGVESISAWHAERFGQQNLTYALITTVEELGEMLGVVIFVYALLSYMSEQTRPVAISATAGRADRIGDSRRAV